MTASPAAGNSEPRPFSAATLLQRQLRGSELALDRARHRAAIADDAAHELSARIRRLEAELAQVRAALAERAGRLRASEQLAFAEQTRRGELEQQLVQLERQRSADAAAYALRTGELEDELESLQRRLDEADHAAAAAGALRAAAPAPVSDQLQQTLSELRDELRHLRLATDRESAARVEAQARAAALEQRLREQRGRAARVSEAIAQLRRELDALRSAYRPDAAPPPDPSGPVESARLDHALVRLRDAASVEAPEAPAAPEPEVGEALPVEALAAPAAPEPEPEPEVREAPAPAPRRAWLLAVFKSLVAREPVSAGRLLLQLLPAQSAADPHPVAYDLILGELACVQVTVRDGPATVDFVDLPRDPHEVRFQVTGDLESIARTLVASRWRRRFGRRMARITGDRGGLATLTVLIRAPLTLTELHAAGVRLDPPLALRVAASMIEPQTTRGLQFTIAHQPAPSQQPDAYLQLADRKLSVTETAPADAATTTIVCPPDELLLALAGAGAPDMLVRGDGRPLELLHQWLGAAQNGSGHPCVGRLDPAGRRDLPHRAD